nr:SET and MYND domain containing protein 4 [Hymenolepis microstoma]
MVEQTVTSEDIIAIMTPLMSAKNQFIAKKYLEFMLRPRYTAEDILCFIAARSDFSHICIYMRMLERHIKANGGTFIGLPNKRETVIIKSGKSDIIAKKYLRMCQKYCDKKSFEKALRIANKAYFSAFSEEVKFDSMSKRCYILLQLEYYIEFLQDAVSCLEINTSIMKKKVIYLLLSKFYSSFNHEEKSKFYLEKAYKREMLEIERKEDVEILRREINNPPHYEVNFKCIRPEPPESLIKLSEPTSENIEERQNWDAYGSRKKLPSAKEKLLQLTDTKSDRGWALKVTKDVPIGSILLKEKPYASVLSFQFTRYCYCCYKRCVNILPCKGCAMVGFCSEKCAEDATNPNRQENGGPGRHVYDCGGLLPCLRLDSIGGNIPERVEMLPTTHLAYTCVANTPPKVLMDCLCSTGRYKKFKHQAFRNTSSSRGNPPSSLDPSDYSTIASHFANPEDFNHCVRYAYYGTAIYLTICLWLSGYPMKWFDEAGESFYTHPSQLAKRPDILPASWVAACMVYHYKTVRFNAIRYAEILEPTNTGYTFYNWLAYCIYPTMSFINHDCDPNACLAFTANGGAYLYALRQMRPGEEVTISYGYYYFSQYPTLSRKAFLKGRYLFDCKQTLSTSLEIAIQWPRESVGVESECELLDYGLFSGALSSLKRYTCEPRPFRTLHLSAINFGLPKSALGGRNGRFSRFQ